MDWQPGDLALCVKQGIWHSADGVPQRWVTLRAGMIVTVRKAAVSPRSNLCLWFDEYPGDAWSDSYHAAKFRKISPHTRDEQDEITIRLLTGQPATEDA